MFRNVISASTPAPGPAAAVYVGSSACSQQHVRASLRGLAACVPRDKVIAVPWPNNTDIHRVSPSHVLVRRCSGGCHASGQGSCVATRVQVRVLIIVIIIIIIIIIMIIIY